MDDLIEKLEKTIGDAPIMCGTYALDAGDARSIVKAALQTIRDEGFVVVPREPDEARLHAGARVMMPGLFAESLKSKPSDGPKTRAHMKEIVAHVRSIYVAMVGAEDDAS